MNTEAQGGILHRWYHQLCTCTISLGDHPSIIYWRRHIKNFYWSILKLQSDSLWVSSNLHLTYNRTYLIQNVQPLVLCIQLNSLHSFWRVLPFAINKFVVPRNCRASTFICLYSLISRCCSFITMSLCDLYTREYQRCFSVLWFKNFGWFL